MKPLYRFLLLSAIILVFWACKEDNGNYDYVSVDQIKIDTTGMSSQLLEMRNNLELGKLIELEPSIVYNKNADELEYYWIIYPFYYGEIQEGNTLVYPKADTIGHSRKLSWLVDITGFYRLQFVATDPVNNLRSFFEFTTVNIPEKGVKSGLYVLSEYDGQTDIDLFGSARALIIGGNHFTPHYYSTSHGGELIPGKPLFISYGKDYYYAFTEQEGKRLNTNSLMLMEDFDQMFYSVPNYAPQNLIYTNNCEFLVNDGYLHVLYTNRTNDRKFSDRIAGNYKAKSFLLKNTKSTVENAINADQIIFDEIVNGFKPYFPLSASIGNFKETTPGAIIDANKMKSKVVTSFEANGGQTYNIMDIAGRDSLFILAFNAVDDGDLSAGSNSRIDLSGCMDIKNAKFFASSNAGNAFFYATDKAVYSFSPTSGQQNQLNIYQTAGGEEITCLYLLPSGGFPTSGSVLWIAVWNESEKEGSLVEFEIDPTSGAISNRWSPTFAPDLSNPSITHGFGKIKSMVIKM